MSPGCLIFIGLASANPVELERWDLSASDGGFVAGGDVGATWEWGVVQNGPESGFLGPSAWGTRLDGPYLNDAEETLTLPDLDLSGTLRPVLGLTHWYAIDSGGSGDFGRIEAWDGSAWQIVEPIYGYDSAGGFSGLSGGWVTSWIDLGGLGDPARLRLVLDTDLALVDSGWFLGEGVLADGDPVPPRITLLELPQDSQVLSGGYTVLASLQDDQAGVSALISWQDDRGNVGIEPMLADGELWRGTLPVAEPDTTVEWQVEGSDGLNTATTPPASFRIYLAAPTGLAGPLRPVAASQALLTWTPPDSPHPVLDYTVWADGRQVGGGPDSSAWVQLVEGPAAYTVRARFDTPIGTRSGDASTPLWIQAALPVLDAVEPDQGWAGDALRLRVSGENLLLVQGEVDLDLGEGLTVESLEVRDVNTLLAQVRILPGASPGPRDLLLQTGAEQLHLPDAFTVRDGADRPRLRQISPESLARDSRSRLTLSFTGDMVAEDAVVDLGRGIVVESVRREGQALLLQVAVADDAPLGEHAVEVDDGARIFAGVSLEVRRAPATVQRGCGLLGEAPGGWALVSALVAALAGRRRRPDPAGS